MAAPGPSLSVERMRQFSRCARDFEDDWDAAAIAEVSCAFAGLVGRGAEWMRLIRHIDKKNHFDVSTFTFVSISMGGRMNGMGMSFGDRPIIFAMAASPPSVQVLSA